MDVSAQVTMKDAAKCDRRCEWQNSANQENVERILLLSVIPGGMSGSGLYVPRFARDTVVALLFGRCLCVSALASCCTPRPLAHGI
jgi:hypothetical protein